jgi:hypothetical protein
MIGNTGKYPPVFMYDRGTGMAAMTMQSFIPIFLGSAHVVGERTSPMSKTRRHGTQIT